VLSERGRVRRIHMPIVKIENISQESILGIWKITENADVLLQEAILSEEELNELSRITNFRRKKEWLSARIILKSLMKSIGVPYEGTYKNEFSKPYLIRNGFHISIAHSFPLAGAMIHKSKPCGMDIEMPKPSLFYIAPKFLNNREDEWIIRKPMDLCLAWAAKEVMYKLCGKKDLSFRENLTLEPYECRSKGEIHVEVNDEGERERVALEYEQIDEMMVCYSL